MKPPTTLRTLPAASEVAFLGAFAWSPVSSSAVTTALGVDPGAWNTWRNRRIAPSPMPEAWFRRRTGQPLVYQASDILVWLAARRGEVLDAPTTWWTSLRTDLGTEAKDADQMRKLVALYARATGPIVGDVRFTPAGFQAYLASLLSFK